MQLRATLLDKEEEWITLAEKASNYLEHFNAVQTASKSEIESLNANLHSETQSHTKTKDTLNSLKRDREALKLQLRAATANLKKV